MNTVLLSSLSINQYINYHLLLLVPFILSRVVESKWIKRSVIKNIKEQPLLDVRGYISFYIFNLVTTVTIYNFLCNLRVPVISKTFFITFFLLSVLWGVYLVFVRIKFKF